MKLQTQKVLRALLVEDSEDDALLILRELRRGSNEVISRRVDTAETMRQALKDEPWDIIIADYSMPRFSAPAALRLLHDSGHDIPFIIVSGAIGEVVAAEAMRSGAHDFVMKHKLARLRPAIDRELRDAEVRRNRRKAERSLRRTHEELEQRVDDRTAELARINKEMRQEIAERTRAERSVRRQQRLIDAIFDSILAHVAYLDPEFNLVRVNATYALETGVGADELIGRNHFEFFPSEENRAIFRKVRETGVPYFASARPFTFPDRPDRGVTYWNWWLYPLPAPGEPTEGLVLSLVDVTESETARREVERLNEELRRANAAKDRFLATLSHELRTPLTPALMMAGTMESAPDLPEPIRRDLAIIRRSIELETRLIDDLLDLTSISQGKLQLKLESLDAHQELQGVLSICAEDIQGRELDVRTELYAADHSVRADRARLQQIFWNIIKNAVKFTPPGGTLTLRSGNPSGGVLRLEFQDNGVGIEAETLPVIFNAFEQGGDPMTRRFGGLGLGLSISKALVELHGGAITALSEGRGRGSTFRVELPAVADEPDRKPRERKAPEGSRRARILLVEDHDLTSTILKMLLGMAGHEVRLAAGVAAALELAAAEPFDLVISDLGLPDGTGLELMRELRARHGLRGLALSGYGMEQDIENSLRAGFDRHLTKPVDARQLTDVIDELLHEGDGDPGREAPPDPGPRSEERSAGSRSAGRPSTEKEVD